jgi:hypothetical protein
VIEKEQELKIIECRDHIKKREIKNVRLFKTNNMSSEISDERNGNNISKQEQDLWMPRKR